MTEYHQFEKEKMRKSAVERQLEIIGQAANKISKETRPIIRFLENPPTPLPKFPPHDNLFP
ncbi:MAG: DUF86 domain-containing protein [Spirochaetaceae bacterium]|nr:DUF86 domain-containing protein [Spirochaetaceae bacterium]